MTNSGAGAVLPFELDQDGTLANNYGADNEGGTVRFPSSLENSPSGLTSGGAAINYHVTNNGLTLTGSTTGGTDVFVIQLNPGTATYTVDMIGTVDVTTDVNFSSGGYDFAGGNTAWNGFIPTTEALGGVFLDNNSPDLLLTPERTGFPSARSTPRRLPAALAALAAASGNNVGTRPETFRIDFVTDLSGNPAGITYADEANRDHVFDGHYTVNGSTAIFASTTGSIVNFAAFIDNDDTGGVQQCGRRRRAPGNHRNLGELCHGSQFFDLSAAGQQSFNNVTIGGQQFTITELGDGTVNISGVVAGTQVGVFTANGYNSLEYSFVSGEAFQIGQFGASVPTTGSVSFDVPIELVDGDGDTVTDSIGVTLSPPRPRHSGLLPSGLA